VQSYSTQTADNYGINSRHLPGETAHINKTQKKKEKNQKKKKKESSFSGGGAKKTRRNGINDGFVCWGCVYAVVPCFF